MPSSIRTRANGHEKLSEAFSVGKRKASSVTILPMITIEDDGGVGTFCNPVEYL